MDINLQLGGQYFMDYTNDKEYILSGTLDQIVAMIERNFDCSREEAKFIVRLAMEEELRDDSRENVHFNTSELDTWYATPTEPVQKLFDIMGVPVSISISKLKTDIGKALCEGVGAFLFSGGDRYEAFEEFIKGFVLRLWNQGILLTGKNKCISFKIIDFYRREHIHYFYLKDLLPPDKDNDKVFYCDMRGFLRECSHRHQHLQDYKNITTVSVGEGNKRHLVIKYVDDNQNNEEVKSNDE